MITALKLHKNQAFPDRMEKVILALKTSRALGKSLLLDMVSMEKRLAMQPEEETKKKASNKSNNSNRDVQLQFAWNSSPMAESAMESTSINFRGLRGLRIAKFAARGPPPADARFSLFSSFRKEQSTGQSM